VAPLLLVAGVVAILFLTLWPLTLELDRLTWARYAMAFELAPASVLDVPRNILLFVPFSFGLASILEKRGISYCRACLLTGSAGLLLTACVESLQTLLPHRTASVSDVVTNTLGALVGWACFRAWQQRHDLQRWLAAKWAPRHTALVLLPYLVLILLLALALMRGMLPGGWNPSYRLALGNELTADRPWRGTLRDLVLLDHAVDKAGAAQLLENRVSSALNHAVVANYPLTDATGLKDIHGTLPDLVSRAGGMPRFLARSLILDDGSWLATGMSVGSLAARINSKKEFTLAITVATLDLTQTGPARIVTVSQDPFNRNLTLGQAGTGLALRWRSPVTGKNGTAPEVQFPGVFDSYEPQRLVITCDGKTARAYTTRRNAGLDLFLGPELGFAAIFHENSYWPVRAGPSGSSETAWLLPAVMFLPLGIFLGAAAGRLRRSRDRIVAVMAGIMLPAMLVEGLVTAYRNGPPRFAMIGLSVALTSLGIVLMHVWQCARRGDVRVTRGHLRDSHRN
jgi:VanZ family protein